MKCFKMTSHPQKNTLLQAAHCHAETQACKRVFFSATQEKLFFKISSPSENKKIRNRTDQLDTDNDSETQQ